MQNRSATTWLSSLAARRLPVDVAAPAWKVIVS